ncbi:MAG: S41 family peptidase [Acidobacteria bacterium]|nr:MAG: S41 family peptidase [Acidobacteriota bacterium]
MAGSRCGACTWSVTMGSMRTPRFLPVMLLAVLLSAVAGGFFGSTALATQDEVAQQYKIFTSALSAIEREYVEEVPSDRLVYGAIDGMLKTLDPHSSFFDPKQYAQMRERQEGRYYGLGISIQVIDGDITVMSVFEGSPAYRAGLRRGDVIARIEGEDTKGWLSEQAVKKLKGPKGTKVKISIRRPGYEKLIDMDAERDEVNITTVRGAFMIDAQTGYIKLGDFSETSDREVGDALDKLQAQGMKRLVFDLRDNPGGPLEQAIRIANRFLPRGDMVVYTRGRVANADQDYRGTDKPDYTGPMMVLVSRQSASASEIVTGALQDHDRALVVGETTFGKALVQSVYRISEGAGLALTTGRYFTPSGRMIQRPWDTAFDEYLTYTLREQTPEREHAASALKYTDAGRKVYSGGGIDPDKFFAGPVQGYSPTRFGRSLIARSAFANFAESFVAEGDTRMGSASEGKTRMARGFTVTDTMVADFKKSLQKEKVKIDEAAFQKDIDFIKAMIHYEIDVALFGISEAQKNLIAKDPQAQFALTQFPDAVKLTELARNRVTSRGGNH